MDKKDEDLMTSVENLHERIRRFSDGVAEVRETLARFKKQAEIVRALIEKNAGKTVLH